MLKDTVFIHEYAKAFVELEEPFFNKEDSKIIVILEVDENYPLKKDLSNEFDIPVEGFHNLSFDTINQKWFNIKKRSYNKCSVFGRKYSTFGNHKMRGYVLEYISENPPMDSISDEKKQRKYYFEKEIFVKDTMSVIPDSHIKLVNRESIVSV